MNYHRSLVESILESEDPSALERTERESFLLYECSTEELEAILGQA